MKNSDIKTMKPEIRNLWVTALRSGQYKQIAGTLCRVIEDNPCYCALGVLCEVHRVSHGNESGFNWDINEERGWKGTYFGESVTLPEEVRKWAGLPCHDPLVVFNEDGDRLSIVDLNDQSRLSFNAIADLIEQEANL